MLQRCWKLEVVSIAKRSHLVKPQDVCGSRKGHLMVVEVYNKEKSKWGGREKGAGHGAPWLLCLAVILHSVRHRECDLPKVVFSKQLDFSNPYG